MISPEPDMQEVFPRTTRPAAAMQNTHSTASEVPLLRRTPGPGSAGSESDMGVIGGRDSYFSRAAATASMPGSPSGMSRSNSPSSQASSTGENNQPREDQATKCLSTVPEADTPAPSSDGHSGLTWLAAAVVTDENGHTDTSASKEDFYSIKTGTSSGDLTVKEGR